MHNAFLPQSIAENTQRATEKSIFFLLCGPPFYLGGSLRLKDFDF